jgi:hypothetical protein
MKVTAIKPGFFGKLRAPGEEFEVPDDTKKSTWFAPVDAKGSKKPTAEKPGDKAPTDLV